MLPFFRSDYSRLFFWSMISTTLVSLFFISFPSLDILISQLFWTKKQGFYLKENFLIDFFSRHNYMLLVGYLAFTFGAFVFYRVYKSGIDYKQVIFLCVSLIVGPGLLVNALLKSFWGRARPDEIEMFGGSQTFSPAWHISDQCPTNCSFVSGHASSAFAFYAFALILSINTRLSRNAFFIVTALGLMAGFGRIVEGRHFLSDILIAGHLVWLVALICYFPVWRAKLTGVMAQ